MKRMIVVVLALAVCLSLCACGQETGVEYKDLIAAIESDDYDRALAELQDLMGVQPTQPNLPTDPPVCTHSGSEPNCLNATYCNKCGELLSEALGHEYVDGYCVRCQKQDPAEAQLLKQYNKVMNDIVNFETNGYVYVSGKGNAWNSEGAKYIYDQLVELGDYRDCAQYLERITVIPDQLLYITLRETDNLGNWVNGTDIEYEYDAQGRVTMSEDVDFLNRLGNLSNSYAHGESQNYVTVTYGEDGRITEYKLYYVSLRQIVTPTYDENGRIVSTHHRKNEGEYTTYFYYDEEDRLIKVQTGTEGDALLYSYNPDGTLATKTWDWAGVSYVDSVTEYLYDENGHMIGWKSETTVPTVECDEQGRILRKHIVMSSGVLEYTYNYGDWYVYTPVAGE